jgi:hypothetical protein
MRGMRAPVVMEKHLGQRPPRIADNQEKQENIRPLKYISRSPETPERPLETAPLEVPSVGKAPLQDMVYAGVSNGESLWAMPNHQSPEASSDSNSVVGQPPIPGAGAGVDELMADIDWVCTEGCLV